MRTALLVSLRMAAVTAILLGLIYPAVVWAVTSVIFPHQAGGSLVSHNGSVVGSALIGQSFTSAKYFHGRPSYAGSGYDAMASSPSNLGPTNKVLIDAVASRVTTIVAEDPGARRGDVPVDLVTGSASGLDPDISPDAAYLQVSRVARARGLSEARVRALVASNITQRQFEFLGERRVNVLQLNLALDAVAR